MDLLCFRRLDDRQKQIAGSDSALLIRLINEPLPKSLDDDLALHVASQWSRAWSWEDWDTQIACETLDLRCECAWALASIDAAAANEPVARLVERSMPIVRNALQQSDEDVRISGRYGALCVQAARLGRKEGVDALIARLPDAASAPGHNYIASNLLRAVGPQIPLGPEPSAEARPEAVARWQQWWATNRERFTLPYTPPPEPRATAIPYPPTALSKPQDTVRSYLWAEGQRKSGGGDVVARLAYPEAGEWLKANAGKYGRNLRKLAEDTTAPRDVRESAARWYVRKGGKRATAWLSHTVLGEKETDVKLRASFGGQFLMSLLGEAPGRETNELARTCVDELNSAAPWAMDILVSRRPRTVDNEFALAHYKSFIARFPNMTDWFVSYFSANPTPNAEIVFADGLENSSQRIAEAAAIAILRQNIEERLPELARRILARRRDDPLFKIGLATADPVKSPQDKVARQAEVARILQTVSGTDAHSAQVYARAYPILADAYSASDSPLSPEANACLESLRKCVAAYQDSRRQNPPQ